MVRILIFMELSVVIPCLNEGRTLEAVIVEAKQGIVSSGATAEIIVADNGSSDDSIEIAKKCGARIVNVPAKGYGSALMAGIEAAKGKYIVMGDADGSYDFREIPKFTEKFRTGYDIVMGNRYKGGIEPGAMPFLNKYLGNPGLTALVWLLHGRKIGDTQCGLRGGSREALMGLSIKTRQFDFASEMVVRALRKKCRIAEVPVKLRPDHIERKPHLRRWRDGIMHCKLILKLAF